MNKPLTFLLLLLCSVCVAKAQVRGFGNIDTADLKLTCCEFERDANAMVLFDRAKVTFSVFGALNLERHKRIKIFNEKGIEYGNLKIQYDNMYGIERVYQIEAQTINFENGKIVTSKIDPKLMYAEHTDKNKDAIVLTFPNVKPGSVIEYRYSLIRSLASNLPPWYFQTDIPTRYSEFNIVFPSGFRFNALTRLSKPLLKDTLIVGGHVWASSNLPSSREEAYMRAPGDALDNVSLLLTSVHSMDGGLIKLDDTWATIGKKLANEKNYYKELDQHLGGEDTLIKQAAALKREDEKIAFLYSKVKTTMSWNGYENWGSKNGIKNAWKKRIGNSAEINAVLYHLLKVSGIKAYPLLVSTRENGLLEPDFVDIFQINNLVTYVVVDSTKYYVIDVTDHYNTYTQIPFNLLNSYGLRLNKEAGKYDMVFLEAKRPSKEMVVINGEIGPDAKIHGTADIVSCGYDRTIKLAIFKTTDIKKYEEFLTENDNNLKLSNLKSENLEVDTLPLKQNFDFTYDLNNTDNYILFSPNIFTTLHKNPFLSEVRSSDIDFGYTNDHVIFGVYKMPPGYKIESLPKDANMTVANKGILFKRTLGLVDGYIQLKYQISVKRSQFLKSEYADLHEFYKKMYNFLNEQIVLKKG